MFFFHAHFRFLLFIGSLRTSVFCTFLPLFPHVFFLPYLGRQDREKDTPELPVLISILEVLAVHR
jgi:hypothetical protein